MRAALFLNFHGSQGLSAPLQRARFPFRIGYCGKPARHTGVSHLLRLLVMQTCLWLSYHMAPTAVNISPASYLYRFTRSYNVFSALAEKPPPPSRESRWDPPAHLWSARTGSRPAALWRLMKCGILPVKAGNDIRSPVYIVVPCAGLREEIARIELFIFFQINSNFVPNTVLAPTFLLPDSAAVSTVSAIPSFAKK